MSAEVLSSDFDSILEEGKKWLLLLTGMASGV
jgi:hypothetical protein